jgi:hypothetical protein
VGSAVEGNALRRLREMPRDSTECAPSTVTTQPHACTAGTGAQLDPPAAGDSLIQT